MPNFTKINTRSPRFLSVTGTAGEPTSVELKLWNDPDTEPATVTKILSKPIPSSNLTTVDYDISPYIREFISYTDLDVVTGLTATDVSSYAYCEAVVKLDGVIQSTNYFIGYNGYGYFEDGYNPILDANVMLTEGTYYTLSGANNGALFYFQEGGLGEIWSATYVCLDGVTANETITLTEENGHIPYVAPTHIGNGGSTLTISKDTVVQNTFTFKEVCEPKYTPIVCDFINKFGAWQTVIFFKVSKSKMTMSNTAYNMMPESVDYSVSKSINQTFNTQGKESITLNTGWVLEAYNDVMKQMLLSNEVRLDKRPVTVNTKSLDLFTSINERNINYTLTFNYANSIINTIQ
tara:strand:- start:378 stop:1424 length:1047 start_codon:yes stop_codon:yes gene_type:complete